MWVFGYGSLIWRPSFPHERRVTGPTPPSCLIKGYIENYARRFWQGSNDHRGTPAYPGRVVTLIPQPLYTTLYAHLDAHLPTRVYGVAYKIAEKDVETVRELLDYRERNGYDTLKTTVYYGDGNEKIEEVLVYIATNENPSFLGPERMDRMVERICAARGVSGRNYDYVLGLSEALRIIGGEGDTHVEALADAIRKCGIEADAGIHGAMTLLELESLKLLVHESKSKL